MKKIPLVMKVWAGSEPHDMEYISRSIPSLLASHLPENLEVIIYDDCSPNAELREFLKSIARRDARVRIIHGTENKGPNLGQQDIYRQITGEYPDAPYFVNVDDDVVYHRDWLTRLLAAQNNCRRLGLNGVFTALNMPYRKEHAVLMTEGERYLLKWKQPALNWLIPRDLYEEVGPFRDEGIAYDTVYSHWMRLRSRPVICMTPSHVQNIGLLGAYATDDTTTCRDFVGEGAGDPRLLRLGRSARFTVSRLPDKMRRALDQAATPVSPIRWGAAFVHEGKGRNGESVAMFSFDDAVRMGWDKHAAARRVIEVQQAGMPEAAAILALRTNRQGEPVWVEVRWRFAPHLRELATLGISPGMPAPETIFHALIRQLVPMHDKRVAHNKIRQENVYLSEDGADILLLWLGTEPCPGVSLANPNNAGTLAMLSGALNRWALPETREACAAQYLESLAPEVIRGQPATPAADLFSAAAVVALGLCAPITTLDQFAQIRGRWEQGVFTELDRIRDATARSVVQQCLATDPAARPAHAREAARLLGY